MKPKRRYISINYEREKFYSKIIPSILESYSNEELYNIINDSMGSILTLLHLIKYSIAFFEGNARKIEGHLCYCYQQETLKIATKLLNSVKNNKHVVLLREYSLICSLFEGMIKLLEEIYTGDSETVMKMIRPESYGQMIIIPDDIPEIRFMRSTTTMLYFISQIFSTATNILKERITNDTIDISEINTFNTSLINRYIILGDVYEPKANENPNEFINKNVRSMDKEYLYDVFKINRMYERELQLNNIGMEVIGSYCFAQKLFRI